MNKFSPHTPMNEADFGRLTQSNREPEAGGTPAEPLAALPTTAAGRLSREDRWGAMPEHLIIPDECVGTGRYCGGCRMCRACWEDAGREKGWLPDLAAYVAELRTGAQERAWANPAWRAAMDCIADELEARFLRGEAEG